MKCAQHVGLDSPQEIKRQPGADTRRDRGEVISQTKSPAPELLGGGVGSRSSRPARKPLLTSSRTQPRSVPKGSGGVTRVRGYLGGENGKTPANPQSPQTCHGPRAPDWGTPDTRSSLTALPQLAAITVDRRHGPEVSRFRAKQPETGAGAETGASRKANQRLSRLRTSARKATDVPRRAALRPRPCTRALFGGWS